MNISKGPFCKSCIKPFGGLIWLGQKVRLLKLIEQETTAYWIVFGALTMRGPRRTKCIKCSVELWPVKSAPPAPALSIAYTVRQ